MYAYYALSICQYVYTILYIAIINSICLFLKLCAMSDNMRRGIFGKYYYKILDLLLFLKIRHSFVFIIFMCSSQK